MKRTLISLTFAITLVVLAGCHCCQRGCGRPTAACPSGPPPGVAVVPPAPVPFAPGPQATQPYPAAPPQGQPFPAAPPTVTPGAANPFPIAPNPPPGGGGLPPDSRVEFRWTPTEPRAQLLPPVPFGDPAQAQAPKDRTAEPPVGKPQPGSSLPVGIPQFAKARENVYTGLRPSLDDGLDWLAQNQFRRVIHVRLPGQDDSADKKQVEQRNMKYLTLEVSPKTLTRETAQEFAQMVRDESGHPLFVYDRDGSLAGAMWYLYFRLIELQPDEVARIRAAGLGLREAADGPHRDMWLAVQRILEK